GARRQCDRAAAALRRAAPRGVAGRPGRVPGEAAARHRRFRRHDSPPGRVGQRAGARADAAAGRLAGGGRVTARRRLSATHGPPARVFFWSMLAAVLTACAPHTPEVAPRSGRGPAAAAQPATDLAQAATLLQQAGAEFAKQNYGGALYLANQAKRVAGAGKSRLGDEGRAPLRTGEVPFAVPVQLQAIAHGNVRDGP